MSTKNVYQPEVQGVAEVGTETTSSLEGSSNDEVLVNNEAENIQPDAETFADPEELVNQATEEKGKGGHEKLAPAEEDTWMKENPQRTNIEHQIATENKDETNDIIEFVKMEIELIQEQLQNQAVSSMEMARLVQQQLQSILNPDDFDSTATVVADLINKMSGLTYDVDRKLRYSVVNKQFIYSQNPENVEDYSMSLCKKPETVAESKVNPIGYWQKEEANQMDAGKDTNEMDGHWGFPLVQAFFIRENIEKEVPLKENKREGLQVYKTASNEMIFHESYLNEYVKKC